MGGSRGNYSKQLKQAQVAFVMLIKIDFFIVKNEIGEISYSYFDVEELASTTCHRDALQRDRIRLGVAGS